MPRYRDPLNRRLRRYNIFMTDGENRIMVGQGVGFNKKDAVAPYIERVDRDWFPPKMFVVERDKSF